MSKAAISLAVIGVVVVLETVLYLVSRREIWSKTGVPVGALTPSKLPKRPFEQAVCVCDAAFGVPSDLVAKSEDPDEVPEPPKAVVGKIEVVLPGREG